MQPIHVPEEWSPTGLLTFEEFCDLIHIPQRTVRDWRRRGVGPHWQRLDGAGRIYITVAETRRFLTNGATAQPGRTKGVDRKDEPR